MNYIKDTITENIFDKTFKNWSREYKIPEYEFWEMMDGFRIPEDRHLEVFEKELEIKKYLFKKK